MDAAHHHHQWPAQQGIGLVKPMEEFASAMAAAITTASSGKPQPPPAAAAAASERKPRPQKEQALNCPRCNSTNTKFCYYNNYSLTQPRYFCKTCRRYWTEGGSLRNVPVGGGSRNNKRSSSSASASTATNGAPPYKKLSIDLINPPPSISTAPKFHEFADRYPSLETSSSARVLLAPFMPPISTPEFTSAGFGLEEFRQPAPPILNFSLDALGGGYGGKTVLFPFEELKPPMVSNNYAVEPHHQFEQNKGQSGGDHPPAFWSGVINGGGSW